MRFSQTWEQPLSLLEMPCGCRLYVEELVGNASTRSKLYSMGILPGTEMELCRGGRGSGNVCVRVRQCLLVLGEGLARGIYCRPADGRAHRGRHCSLGQKFRSFCHGGANVCHCSDTPQQPRPVEAGDNAAGEKKDNNV